MKITKRQDYGILLMVKLAKEWQRRLVPLSEVASFYHLSPLFLKQIATALKTGGLIKSKEGVDGGYMLARPPKTISLAQIIQSLAGLQILNPGCAICSITKACPPKMVWQKINKEILKSLGKITLTEVAK